MMEPEAHEVEVETTSTAEENVAKQQTGLTDVAPDAEAAAPGATVNFPQHQPRLLPGGKATLKALTGR